MRQNPHVRICGGPGSATTLVYPTEFQPGVRREANVIELQRQIPIDTGMQIGFSSSHGQWPLMCGRRRWVAPPFNHTGRPFSIPKRHCSLRKMTH